MAAGGAIVKAAGKPAPKTWPEVNSYERMKNVIDGMCIALEDAPLVFREGLDRLADEMLSRHNAEPTLSWTRMYKLLVDLAGKRAKIMDKADANHVAVTLLPWDTLDIEFEMQLATEVATMKCVDEARRAADAKAAASGGGDGGGGRGRDGGGEGKSRDDKRKKERDAEREREREKKRKRESEREGMYADIQHTQIVHGFFHLLQQYQSFTWEFREYSGAISFIHVPVALSRT